MADPISRRELLRTAALGSIGLGLAGSANALTPNESDRTLEESIIGPPQKSKSMIGVAFEKRDTVRLAFIGTGLRGRSVMDEFVNVPNVKIVAVNDTVKEKAEMAKAIVEKAGQPAPAVYVDGDHGYRELLKRDDIDLVYIATPWEWHVPQAIDAMKAGKHASTEVPAGYTLPDLWKLVDTSEATRKHCMMMENCCYGWGELFALSLVKAGVLGAIVHGEGAYNHDLREILFETRDEGLWRRRHHTLRNSNLYPTHGLGPVANYMDINRGDKFDYMVAMSSGTPGLYEYREAHLAEDDPRNAEKYIAGDYNTNLIKTAKGRSIMVQHNVTTPRPYDRINLVQGTKGIYRDYPARVYLEATKANHQWQDVDQYKAKYEHYLWKEMGDTARKLGGHGGMDYIMCYRLIQCIREGLVPDMDVYDAAAWSSPGPLSEISVAKGSAPIKFPDFTRGGWQHSRESIPVERSSAAAG
jgi:hypothetical protein